MASTSCNDALGQGQQKLTHADRLLHGPVLLTLLRLSVANIVVMIAQAAANFFESYYVGRLGVDALAGAALVFPSVMVMQMLSAGALGGGISSSIARAIGRNRPDDAAALARHGIALSLGFGVGCTVIALVAGPYLYKLAGGTDGALRAATMYSNTIFCGIVFLWLLNAQASILRGTGNMVLPAIVVCGGILVLVLVSPILIFGWGDVAGLGIVGAGLALVVYYVLGALVLFFVLRAKRSTRDVGSCWRFNRAMFAEILSVGGFAAANSLMMNVAIMVATAIVGTYGTAAIAGFGLGTRLEFLLVPIVFGVGAAMIPMVGMSTGAGNLGRARDIAWKGALTAAGLCECIGVVAAIWPEAWLTLFTQEPEVLRVGSVYLQRVGPGFGMFGLGLALYFASQGAKQMGWSVIAAIARAAIVASASWFVTSGDDALEDLLDLLLLAMACYAFLNSVPWIRGKNRDAA